MKLDDWEKAGIYTKLEHAGEYDRAKNMTWTGSLAQLAAFETIRDGRAPELEIWFTGEFFLIPLHGSNHMVLSEPSHFHSSSGNIRVCYAKELLVEMLRNLGVGQNVCAHWGKNFESRTKNLNRAGFAINAEQDD